MMKTGAELIADERRRQIEEEGWTVEHDSQHEYGTLAVIAASLACDGTDAEVHDPFERGNPCAENDGDCWGLIKKHGHKSGNNRIKCLTIAGALIAAEIDRLQAKEGAK
jgi:hypothetical protein